MPKKTVYLLLLALLLSSCKKHDMKAGLNVKFAFTYADEKLELNEEYTIDTITSQNIIEVEEIKYFISELSFIDKDGKSTTFVNDSNTAHYVDINMEQTLNWTPTEELPIGIYEYIEFVYGFREETNVSHRFLNAPESMMFWPETLGGGYHYMQINGKYKLSDTATETRNFGLHTGIGQIWENDIPKEYIQNYVIIRDTQQIFIAESSILNLEITMDVSKWFAPEVWDFGVYGGAIMQNQDAQEVLKANAKNVFNIEINPVVK